MSSNTVDFSRGVEKEEVGLAAVPVREGVVRRAGRSGCRCWRLGCRRIMRLKGLS
jgi:hypothetical protein